MSIRCPNKLIALAVALSAFTSAVADTCVADSTQAAFQAGTASQVDLSTSPGEIRLLNATAIDQQNTTLGTSGVGITTTTWGGQTFTPSVTGQLTRIDVHLFCSGCTGTTPNLTMSLRATSGGLPTGADLASATVTGFSSGSDVAYTASFASPYTVSAGVQYAFVIRPTANPSPGTYALTRSGTSTAGSDVYAGGTRVAGATSGTVWSIPLTGGVSTDAGFQAYINTGYASAGNLVSSTRDSAPPAGSLPIWTTLSWTATTPTNTQARFQVAGSNSSSGPFDFIGPDGTPASTYTTSGASLSQFNGLRYLQYKALLTSSDTAATPIVSDVTTCYSHVPIPVVSSLSPDSGPAGGGNAVTITGTGFTGATQVGFGANNASSVTVNSDSQITAIVPTGAAGVVDVTVTTAGGTSAAVAADQYTYVAAPAVTGINPGTGPMTGGTPVTITGTNLTGATAVKFGTANASSLTVNSATEIIATSPAGSVGTVDVTVVTAGGTSALNAGDQFTYVLRQLSNIPTAAGGQTLSAQIVSGSPRCSIDPNNTMAFTPPPFNGIAPPYGGLKLTLVGCENGETARVSVTWPSTNGLRLKKYGKTPASPGSDAYYDPANVSISGTTVSYDITDNGLGDDTFTGADGVINDPAVLVSAPVNTTAIPTLDEWGRSLLLLMVAALGIGWLRRRHEAAA